MTKPFAPEPRARAAPRRVKLLFTWHRADPQGLADHAVAASIRNAKPFRRWGRSLVKANLKPDVHVTTFQMDRSRHS
jgi:hypothetical protein